MIAHQLFDFLKKIEGITYPTRRHAHIYTEYTSSNHHTGPSPLSDSKPTRVSFSLLLLSFSFSPSLFLSLSFSPRLVFQGSSLKNTLFPHRCPSHCSIYLFYSVIIQETSHCCEHFVVTLYLAIPLHIWL